jgi:hypothetical protein
MGGYINEEEGFSPSVRPRFGRLTTILFMVLYFVPLFILQSLTDFPNSFGVHEMSHGRGRALEDWFYSYLLLQRHQVLDVITFAYMWAPIVGFIAWLVVPRLRKMNFSLYSNETE